MISSGLTKSNCVVTFKRVLRISLFSTGNVISIEDIYGSQSNKKAILQMLATTKPAKTGDLVS